MGTHEPAALESDLPAVSPGPTGHAPLGAPLHAALSVIALQRAAGNAAVAGLLQRQPAPPAPTVTAVAQIKHTYTIPDKKLGGAKELGYAQAQFKVGGVIDLEITPPQPAPAPEAAQPPPAQPPPAQPPPAQPPPASGGGSGGVTLKGSGGVNVGDGGKYQAEVTAEFDKRVGGILDGCTPKAKVGGEVGAGKAKLGLEVSLEGQTFEPKFGFTVLDINKEDGIKFATLEAAVDWKIKEFTHKTADGAEVKVTPKATPKVEIAPNYKRIATALLEGGVEGAASLAAEAALLAGPPLLVGILVAQGIYMAGEKGKLQSNILEGAVDARQAAMSYAQVMTGSEQSPQGPRATAAVAEAKKQLSGITARSKVSVEDLMTELRKNASRDFVRIHSQARQQVFSAYYSEVRKVIGAWRKEHYILAAWTEEADDINAATKQVDVVFSH